MPNLKLDVFEWVQFSKMPAQALVVLDAQYLVQMQKVNVFQQHPPKPARTLRGCRSIGCSCLEQFAGHRDGAKTGHGTAATAPGTAPASAG